jgi:hypothetical protein
MMTEVCQQQEFWLSLPWLANGGLSQGERARVEEHVRGCALCARELATQRLMCHLLTEPERITYAPGPSFRKLMDRIDGRASRVRGERRAAPARSWARITRSAWRPPGFAWAATFLLMMGFSVLTATAYRWSRPAYATYMAQEAPAPAATGVLHIAFVPSLQIAEVEELLRAEGARVVEGPDRTGVFGITPAGAEGTADARAAQLRSLAAELRADRRVRWVEPVAGVAPAVTPERPREP